MILRQIAGIYAGTAKVNKTDEGYSIEGFYDSGAILMKWIELMMIVI